jgi:predicted TIM-barrel fold metal-dependent hydrolase
VHVFGPQRDFPYVTDRRYTPPDATIEDYRALMAALGLSRAVLSAPSIHGLDNRALLHGLAIGGPGFRGIVMVPADVDDATLRAYHQAGVRGLRTQLKPGGGRPLEIGQLRALAARVAPLGWHAEIHADVGEITGIDRLCDGFPVPVVIEHMGHMPAGAGAGAPGFQALLRLVRDGGWVKLSGPYINSAQPPPHEDVLPFVAALLEAAPDRAVWGTNWPHPHQDPVPDDHLLAGLLARWTGDGALMRAVLADNPARLYDFGPA